jgi:hypothetical protein
MAMFFSSTGLKVNVLEPCVSQRPKKSCAAEGLAEVQAMHRNNTFVVLH